MSASRNLELSMLLQSMAQTGLEFSRDSHDIERYQKIRAIAAEIAAEASTDSAGEIEAVFSLEKGYATPKIDVRAAVFREGRILLVRERSDGCWTLPGGWADVGDSPGEAVTREVYEESGFSVRPVRLLAVLDRRKHGHPASLYHVYKIFLHCEITGGSARASEETSEVAFFDERELPILSRERVTPEQVGIMFEHHRNPDRPVDFD
jgi:ADP-ribose pyrophosphatase YjhB (NUDIX family)